MSTSSYSLVTYCSEELAEVEVDYSGGDTSSASEEYETSEDDSVEDDALDDDELTEDERQLLDCFSDHELIDEDVLSILSSVEHSSPQKKSPGDVVLTNLQTRLDVTTPLYPKAVITQFQSLVLVLLFAIRHGLSGKGISELLQLFRVHLPPSARLPSTVHTLRRYFLRAYPECQSQAYSYCDLCHRVLQIPQEVCEDPGCGGNPDYFICTKLELQVKRLLEGMFLCTLITN